MVSCPLIGVRWTNRDGEANPQDEDQHKDISAWRAGQSVSGRGRSGPSIIALTMSSVGDACEWILYHLG